MSSFIIGCIFFFKFFKPYIFSMFARHFHSKLQLEILKRVSCIFNGNGRKGLPGPGIKEKYLAWNMEGKRSQTVDDDNSILHAIYLWFLLTFRISPASSIY
jgi:hypothetical protein